MKKYETKGKRKQPPEGYAVRSDYRTPQEIIRQAQREASVDKGAGKARGNESPPVVDKRGIS